MSQFISLQQAIDMTTLYRQQKENILEPAYKNQNIQPRCETFDRATLDTLLAKPDCVSIRIYYGMDASLKVHAILVAVDNKGNDILPASGMGGMDIVEDGQRCPVDCPPPSPLNP